MLPPLNRVVGRFEVWTSGAVVDVEHLYASVLTTYLPLVSGLPAHVCVCVIALHVRSHLIDPGSEIDPAGLVSCRHQNTSHLRDLGRLRVSRNPPVLLGFGQWPDPGSPLGLAFRGPPNGSLALEPVAIATPTSPSTLSTTSSEITQDNSFVISHRSASSRYNPWE